MEHYLVNARTVNPDFSTADHRDDPPSNIKRRLGIAITAFFVWGLSVALIAIIPAMFLLPYLASLGVPLSDTGQIADLAKSDQTAIFLQLAAILPAHLLTLLIAYVVITQGRKFEFFKTLGWETGGVRWWHYCIIMGGFFAIAAVVNYFVPEQDNDLLRILRSSRSAVFVIAFIATFSAPLVEEVIYRGVLYSGFQRAFGVPAAFALVTILFSLVHVPQYYPSVSTILLLTLLSVTLTGLRIWSNSLWPCVVLHTIFNGLQSVLLIAEPWLRSMVPEASPAFFVLNEIWTRQL